MANEAAELPQNTRLVRVRMFHTDLLGAVYHPRYFDLFEEARTEIFRALGYTYHTCTEQEGRLMIIVRASCEFKRPVHMDDLLAITVRVAALSRARITFAYDVHATAGGELAAQGEQVFAFLDAQTTRPTSIPPRLAVLIRATPSFQLDELVG